MAYVISPGDTNSHRSEGVKVFYSFFELEGAIDRTRWELCVLQLSWGTVLTGAGLKN